MAKRKSINGRNYTLFIDYDRAELRKHPEDWIEWLTQRVLFILIDSIEEILKKENKDRFDNENFTIFLGIMTLICCGIDAMGAFYKGPKATRENFKNFVKDYMNSEYKKDSEKLNILYNYFRCGLAHGFCIKQGGMYWGKKYFFKDKKLGLQISIIELFKDFKQAFFKYMKEVKKAKRNSCIKRYFERRFQYVFILGR